MGTVLADTIGRGATGSKPAAAAANEGYLYFDTTLGQLQRSNGSAWQVVDPTDLIAAKGDLLVGSAADTLVVKTVGTNGHVLTADSTAAGGVKWAAAAASGAPTTAEALSNTDTTVNTTIADVTNCSISATPAVLETWIVHGVFDFAVTANSTATAQGFLDVDGANETEFASFASPTATARCTASQTWVLTSVAASAHTIKLRVSKTAASGTILARAASKITLIRFVQ